MSDDSWSRVSVCIVTLNEEENLPRCLESFLPCGEVVIVDSGSTDRTRAIAVGHGAKWFTRAWEGFAKQRAFAESQSECEFVLFLDADEWLSCELRTEVGTLLASDAASKRLFAFHRRSEFLSRSIHYGDWSNDWVTRLTPHGQAEWRGNEPHPRLASAHLALHKCSAPLFHRPYRDEQHFAEKNTAYAIQLGSPKRKPIAAVTRAAWRFIRGYVFRGGFLDGYPGYVIARGYARMVYRKYGGPS